MLAVTLWTGRLPDYLSVTVSNLAESFTKRFFLSDGLPNRGNPSEPPGILKTIAKENRYARVAIHTVQLLRGRAFKHDQPKDKIPPLDRKEKERRRSMREYAPQTKLGGFLAELARQNDGTFGVGFADAWMPPPGAKFRPSSDK